MLIKVKEKTPLNVQQIEIINSMLNEMKKIGQLEGIVFANQNGDLIAENINIEFKASNFAAMGASILENAEDLGKSLNSGKVGKITAELENGQTIIIIQYNKKAFFCFILGKQSKMESIMNYLDNISFNFPK